MKRSILAVALCILVGSVAVAAVNAQTPRINLRYSSTFGAVQPPGPHVELAITVSEFDPGARTVLHSNPVTRYFTVIQGELTITIGQETKVYTAGMNGVSPGGIYTRISNERGTAKAQLFLTSLWLPLPPGPLPPVTIAPGETLPALGPRVIATGRTQVHGLPGSVSVVQWVQDWDPGARNSPHTMNHPHLFISLEGENTSRYSDGEVMVTRAGQQGVMEPGRPGFMENTGTTNNRLLVAWVLTSGAPNTSPVPTPAASQAIVPPAAGEAGIVSDAASDDGSDVLPFALVATAAALVVAVTLVRRSLARR